MINGSGVPDSPALALPDDIRQPQLRPRPPAAAARPPAARAAPQSPRLPIPSRLGSSPPRPSAQQPGVRAVRGLLEVRSLSRFTASRCSVSAALAVRPSGRLDLHRLPRCLRLPPLDQAAQDHLRDVALENLVVGIVVVAVLFAEHLEADLLPKVMLAGDDPLAAVDLADELDPWRIEPGWAEQRSTRLMAEQSCGLARATPSRSR